VNQFMLFTALYRMLLAVVFRHNKDAISSLSSFAGGHAVRALDFYVQRADQLRTATDNAAGLLRLYQVGFTVLVAFACVLIYQSFIADRDRKSVV
jgi:hypothetical protein